MSQHLLPQHPHPDDDGIVKFWASSQAPDDLDNTIQLIQNFVDIQLKSGTKVALVTVSSMQFCINTQGQLQFSNAFAVLNRLIMSTQLI